MQISLRFYAQLNRFLPRERRQLRFEQTIAEGSPVKHAIENAGVPHTEVGLVLVGDEPVSLAHVLTEGDRVSVYPPFALLDVTSLQRAAPPAPAEPRFVLDIHLGKLAAHLRMLGFDTLYRNDYDDATLARLADADERILLTRDRALLRRRAVRYGCYVWETSPERQLAEVIHRYDLLSRIAPFRRCLHCNGALVPVAKDAIAERLLPKTRRYYAEFRQCADCGQIYWKGSHYEQMQRFLATLLAQDAPGAG